MTWPLAEPSGWAEERGLSVEATRQAQCAVAPRNEAQRKPAPAATDAYPRGSSAAEARQEVEDLGISVGAVRGHDDAACAAPGADDPEHHRLVAGIGVAFVAVRLRDLQALGLVRAWLDGEWNFTSPTFLASR